VKTALKVLLAVCIIAVGSQAWAAGFTNGNFETGNFNGWTKGGANPNDSAIVGVGTDPNTLNALSMVANGNYAARVGDQAGGSHVSTLSQTVVGWTDASIQFAWAAVLQEPTNGVTHTPAEMPSFSVKLLDLSNNTTLYDQSYNISNLPASTFHNGVQNTIPGYDVGLWHYSDWAAVSLDTTANIGHNLELIIQASDCTLGGHGGYVYLDEVGSTPPVINTPEPGTMLLLGCALVGLYGIKRKVS